MIDYKARNRLTTAEQKISARIITPPPMLTIIDDDGHTDYKDYLLPFCKEVNAPISTAVTPMRFGGQSGVGRYMTLAEIKECHAAGAEVLCHSLTHTPDNADITHTHLVNGQYVSGNVFNDLSGNPVTGETDGIYHDTTADKWYTYDGQNFGEITNITIPDYSALVGIYADVGGYSNNGQPVYSAKQSYYIDKLTKYYTIAKNILKQNGFDDGDIIVYNNDTGDNVVSLNAAKRVFRCGFDINGSRINTFGNIDRRQVHRYSIENSINGYYGVERMKELIDQVVASGGWMVWTMHTTGQAWRGTTAGGHTGIGRDEVLNRLRQAINYAHSKNLMIVTASYGCSAYIDGVS